MIRKKRFNLFFSFSSLCVVLCSGSFCCTLGFTSENSASWWSLLLMKSVCSVSRCCLAPQIIIQLFLWCLSHVGCFLYVSPTTWWVIICEYFMFLKLSSLLFRKHFTEHCNSFIAATGAMCTQTSSPLYQPRFLPVAVQEPHCSLPKELAAAQGQISRAYIHLADFLTSLIYIAPRYL